MLKSKISHGSWRISKIVFIIFSKRIIKKLSKLYHKNVCLKTQKNCKLFKKMEWFLAKTKIRNLFLCRVRCRLLRLCKSSVFSLLSSVIFLICSCFHAKISVSVAFLHYDFPLVICILNFVRVFLPAINSQQLFLVACINLFVKWVAEYFLSLFLLLLLSWLMRIFQKQNMSLWTIIGKTKKKRISYALCMKYKI